MINRLLVISLIFLSLGSSAIVVTDEYLTTIENNWLSLEPDDAYDFIPEDLTYEMYMSEEFQAKLTAEGTRLNNSVEGKDIALAGFMVPIEYQGTRSVSFYWFLKLGSVFMYPLRP
jgi:hypothetical protein